MCPANLSNTTVNVKVEVRIGSDDGFAIITAPVMILDPQIAAAIAAALRSNGAELLTASRAYAMADCIDEALDRASSLATAAASIGSAA